MMNKLLTIFMLLTLSIGVMAEANVIHLDDESSVSHVDGDDNTSIDKNHEECQDNDCHDEKGHCSHNCSGIHNFASLNNSLKISPIFRTRSKILWSYQKHYKKPALDPALRPPTNS